MDVVGLFCIVPMISGATLAFDKRETVVRCGGGGPTHTAAAACNAGPPPLAAPWRGGRREAPAAPRRTMMVGASPLAQGATLTLSGTF